MSTDAAPSKDKAEQFFDTLSSEEKTLFTGMSPKAQKWLREYLNCFPGPKRDFLIERAAGTPKFRTIALRIILDARHLFFKGVGLNFSQICAFRKALKPFETITVKSEVASDWKDETPSSTKSVKHQWGKLGTGMQYGTQLPPTGITANQTRTPDPEVTLLLAELEKLVVETATTEEELKVLFNDMPITSPNFPILAMKLLKVSPTEATLRSIIFKQPKLESRITTALNGRKLQGSVESKFDKDVMGF